MLNCNFVKIIIAMIKYTTRIKKSTAQNEGSGPGFGAAVKGHV